MEKININEELLFKIFRTINPKYQVKIRRINFIIKLLKYNENHFNLLFKIENKEIKIFYESSLKEIKIIKKDLNELKESKILEIDEKKLKEEIKKLFLKKLEEENEIFKKIKNKNFEFIKIDNRKYLKSNLILIQNRIKPKFIEIEDCFICEENHTDDLKTTFEKCKNKFILKLKKIYLKEEINEFNNLIEIMITEKNLKIQLIISKINNLFTFILFKYYNIKNEIEKKKIEEKKPKKEINLLRKRRNRKKKEKIEIILEKEIEEKIEKKIINLEKEIQEIKKMDTSEIKKKLLF